VSPLSTCPCRQHHKFQKLEVFLHQKMLTSASEETSGVTDGVGEGANSLPGSSDVGSFLEMGPLNSASFAS